MASGFAGKQKKDYFVGGCWSFGGCDGIFLGERSYKQFFKNRGRHWRN